jgi:hypothetical protein
MRMQMFLPMSWMSPLTVAKTIVPLGSVGPLASRRGWRTSTPFFMVSAPAIRWGMNFCRAPKRSPSRLMAGVMTSTKISKGAIPSASAVSTRGVMASRSPSMMARSIRSRVVRGRSGVAGLAPGAGEPAAAPFSPWGTRGVQLSALVMKTRHSGSRPEKRLAAATVWWSRGS